MKQKLLLQSCCGPCSTTAIKRLEAEYDLTLFFWGNNIHPQEEYTKRLAAQLQVNQAFLASRNIIIVPYDPNLYYNGIKGLELEEEGGARCDKCFELRMEACARQAKADGYDLFASTLSVSPHKNSKEINSIGLMLQQKYGVPFLQTDLKKQNGFLQSTQYSKQLGLYRQNYCGCSFSLKKGYLGDHED